MNLTGKVTIHAGKPPKLGEPAGKVLKECDISQKEPGVEMRPSERDGFTDVFRDGKLIGRIANVT